MKLFNLTQHIASKEQIAAGVIEPNEEEKKKIEKLLTFDELPDNTELSFRAIKLAKIALKHYGAMIGGAPFFMSRLEEELENIGVKPYYAFSKRVVEEKSGIKVSLFKHEGFVEG